MGFERSGMVALRRLYDMDLTGRSSWDFPWVPGTCDETEDLQKIRTVVFLYFHKKLFKWIIKCFYTSLALKSKAKHERVVHMLTETLSLIINYWYVIY